MVLTVMQVHLADAFALLGSGSMWMKTIVSATALVIAGSMSGYAQQTPGGPSPSGAKITAIHAVSGFTREDLAAFADARIAALHVGLKLNADQERNWPALEKSLHEINAARIWHFPAVNEQQKFSDPVARLRRLADGLSIRGAAFKRVADALEPLYQSFDDGQKRRFEVLARFVQPLSPHFGDILHDNPYHFGAGDGMPD